MKSFQEIYTEVQDLVQDDSAAMLTRIKRWINDTQDIVLASAPWKFLETTTNISSLADTGRYELDNNVRKIINVKTTPDSGSTYYRPDPVLDPNFWDYLLSLNAGSSDEPQYFYQEGNDLLLWPDYATAGDNITVRFRQQWIHMSRDDYTTGTIAAATNGDETIEGGSTVWTGRKPVGNQFIRIDYTNGDYAWYKIASITDNDTLELEKKYKGTSFTSQTESYTIGEFPFMPGNFHSICFYRPLALAYMHIENLAMSNKYWKLYDGGLEAGDIKDYPEGLLGKMMKEQSGTIDSAYIPPHKRINPLNNSEERARQALNEGGSW